MAFEAFQKKQRVLTELMEALKKIEDAVPELSAFEINELMTGMQKLVGDELDQRRMAVAQLQFTPTPQFKLPKTPEAEFPPPTKAVELLLAQTNQTGGLSANEIVTALEGKVKTNSDKPRDVIYSAIAHLKKEGRIVQLLNKNYIPAEEEDGGSEPDEDAYTDR